MTSIEGITKTQVIAVIRSYNQIQRFAPVSVAGKDISRKGGKEESKGDLIDVIV